MVQATAAPAATRAADASVAAGTSRQPIPALAVRDLSVTFVTRAGPVRAVRDFSLSLAPGEIVGLVGESGSGKSVACQAMMGLLPNTAFVGGTLAVAGIPVDPGDSATLARLRGRTLSMIFQDPMSALDPLMSVRGHLRQRLARHGAADNREGAAADLLHQAGVPQPRDLLRAYPHQLSGGLCQRVAIALALTGEPAVLFADEPTTALDVTVQAQVLRLLAELAGARGLAVVLVSHDLGVVADVCARIAVMYAGEIVETGPCARVLSAPAHPYTDALIRARPQLSGPRQALVPIPGQAPTPAQRPQGCAFAPRCRHAAPVCATPPPMRIQSDGAARCHFAPAHA